jgi:short-subunit dehydrogenase
VTVLPKDLARDGAVPELTDELAARGLTVDVLINNAGFTQFGPFAQLDEQEMLDLLHVNMVTLSQLTRRLLPGMLERGRGRVLNLSSNAAFQPGPLMAAYYASKAYVLNLSLALTEEVRGSGVTVTAVCPGPTRTGFQARASMEDSKLVAGRRLPGPAEVAAWAWTQAKAGRPFAVHGLRWKAVAFGTRLMPRSLVARFAMAAQSRVGS